MAQAIEDLSFSYQLAQELRSQAHKELMRAKNDIEVQALNWLEDQCEAAFALLTEATCGDLLDDLYSPTTSFYRTISQGRQLMLFKEGGVSRQGVAIGIFLRVGIHIE